MEEREGRAYAGVDGFGSGWEGVKERKRKGNDDGGQERAHLHPLIPLRFHITKTYRVLENSNLHRSLPLLRGGLDRIRGHRSSNLRLFFFPLLLIRSRAGSSSLLLLLMLFVHLRIVVVVVVLLLGSSGGVSLSRNVGQTLLLLEGGRRRVEEEHLSIRSELIEHRTSLSLLPRGRRGSGGRRGGDGLTGREKKEQVREGGREKRENERWKHLWSMDEFVEP